MFKELLSTSQGFITFIRIVEILAFFTLFVLMILGAIPLFISNTNTTIHYASQQTALVERMTKDTLILASSTTLSGAKDQAINELQTTLPVFEINQKILQNTNLETIDESFFQDSTSPYAYIDAAVKIILKDPKNKTTVSNESEILLSPDHQYFVDLAHISNNLQTQEYSSRYLLFFLEEGVCLILVGIKTIFWVSVESAARRYKKPQENLHDIP